MRVSPEKLTWVVCLCTAWGCYAQEPPPTTPSDSSTDRILFKNGSVFEGQIVEGTKTLIDDPNRYEIILRSGQTLSIEDTGQIDSIQMDGLTLDDPMSRGGRGELLEMLRAFREKTSAEEAEERKRTLSSVVDFVVGEVSRMTGEGTEPQPVDKGARVLPGEELQASPAARVRLMASNRVHLGLEEASALTISNIRQGGGAEPFVLELALTRGSVWIDAPDNLRNRGIVEIRVDGLRFQFAEGLFRVHVGESGEITVAHFRGPESFIERAADGVKVVAPAETTYTIPSAMRDPQNPFEPRRERLTEENSWLEFTSWRPISSGVPVQFTLIGKPNMQPRPIAPILGLSSDRFVFQDLQPIALTGLAPILQTYRSALRRFETDVGRPPSIEEGLQALRASPEGLETWQGPYLPEDFPDLDPWGKPLVYSTIETPQGRLIELYSTGENGIDEQGLGDDLR